MGTVYLSGLAEIAGGIGLLIPGLRRAAGIGLIALLIAVFPGERADAFDGCNHGRTGRLPDNPVLAASAAIAADRMGSSISCATLSLVALYLCHISLEFAFYP